MSDLLATISTDSSSNHWSGTTPQRASTSHDDVGAPTRFRATLSPPVAAR
jgi:hypothetical protein